MGYRNFIKAATFLLLVCIAACGQNSDRKKKDAKPQTENIYKDQLTAVLDTIWRTEQDPIRLRDSIMKVHGPESVEAQEQQAIFDSVHAVNESKVIKILEEQGWPKNELIGEQGSLTISNVIQHSNQAIRIKYLPMMQEAVKDKQLDPRLLARARDRIATEKGELQIYGGQMKYYPETKSFNVWPVSDPENIDKRRAEIGLEPIADFLKTRFDFEWNLEEQLKRTLEFEKKKNNGKE